MFPGSLRTLTFQRIKTLSLPESEAIDYKEKVESTDRGNFDFAKDVCAFANSEGGDIVIGVKERNLTSVSYPGIDSPIDAQNRLNDIILSRIEPRIHGATFHEIRIDNSEKYLLIVRVPKSFNGPHWENSKRNFYRRHNQRNDLMSWREVQNSFLYKRNVSENIRDFLSKRMQNHLYGKVYTQGPPVSLMPGITVIIHIVPIESFGKDISLDVQKIRDRYSGIGPFPLVLTRDGMSWEEFSKLNIDGILRYQAPGNNYSYTQLFRNGIVEAVRIYRSFEGKTSLFPIIEFEREFRAWLHTTLKIFKELEVQPPFYAFIIIRDGLGSVIDTRTLGGNLPVITNAYSPLDRDPLSIPETIIEDFEENLDVKLRMIFTAVWNAYGMPRPSSLQ